MYFFIGGFILVIYGDKEVLVLQIGSALLGFGMASIFATGKFEFCIILILYKNQLENKFPNDWGENI